MQLEPRRLHEQVETGSRLSALGPGLTEAVLGDAVRDGYEWTSECTDNDVRSMGGFLSWGKPLRALREQLAPHGWTKRHLPSLETVVSPDHGCQITVAGGNSATGLEGRMPSTRLDKGPLTGLAVAANAQVSFPRSVHPDFGNPAELDLNTWVLLFYVDETANDGAGEIRAELSRPDHFTGKKRGFVDSFRPRIRLEAISLAEADELLDHETEEEIDIPVARRPSS